MPLAVPLPELARALRSGELPLPEYLDRLRIRHAEAEPQVQAWMPEPGRWERLAAEAGALLERYPEPSARPPLFGLPFGVKDIFHVDGLPTTGGSRLPPEVLAGPQAESVNCLKAAGALILGKTVSTEFAYFGPGPTRNPRNLAHTPGGSSSGSAAAVAAGLCPLALGTQTIGSIIRPAAYCGAAGYKPTYERVSRAGIIPLSPSLDHVGLLAERLDGLALAAPALVENWQPTSAESPRPALGIPEGPYLSRAGSEMRAHFEAVVQRLHSAGWQLRRVPAMPDFEAIYERHYLMVNGEAARVHRDWFALYGHLYHPKTVEKLRMGQQIDDHALAQARNGRGQLRSELQALMDAHGLDAWLAPSAPGPAPRGLDSTGDPVMNLPWSQAGLPCVGLPSGLSADGLPLGVQLVGRWGADESVMDWARGIEAALSWPW